MDDRTQIPNIGAAISGPTGASIGEQGSADPRNIVNIAFPPSEIIKQAAAIAALAQRNAKNCPPDLFQTFSGVTAGSNGLTMLTLDVVPKWWIMRFIGVVGRCYLTVAQGFQPLPGNQSTSGTASPGSDFAGICGSTNQERIVLPGTDRLLYIVGDTGSPTANYSIAAVGGDYDPSRIF